MNRYYVLVLLSIGTFSNAAHATIQEASLLILEGEHVYTYDLPRLEDAFPGIKFPEFELVSTANRKGYTATWATFQNQLYLVGLQGRTSVKGKLLKNEGNTPGHSFPLKVTSWSGKVRQIRTSSVVDGDSLKRTDIRVTTTITVKKGKVIDVKVREERKPSLHADE